MGKHGICHVEWSSTDLKKTQHFYGGLFGWKFDPWGEEYVLFKAPDGIGGGFMKMKKVTPGESPRVYVEVAEIEPYLTKAKDLGGQVTAAKTQIDPSVGWYAHLSDPDGNLVGLFQSAGK